jgi:hypothetical protein
MDEHGQLLQRAVHIPDILSIVGLMKNIQQVRGGCLGLRTVDADFHAWGTFFKFTLETREDTAHDPPHFDARW